MQIEKVPIVNGSNELYGWIIGILIVFIIGLIVYFRAELKTVRDTLREEQLYIRTESIKTMSLLQAVNTVLERLTNTTEKSLENTNEMKPLIQTNVHRLETIKDHVLKLNNKE